MKMHPFLAVLFVLAGSCESLIAADSDALPKSWYDLSAAAAQHDVETLSPPAEKAIEHLFDVNLVALDKMEALSKKSQILSAQPSQFKLSNINFDLSLSLGGHLGLMVASGSETVSISWQKMAYEEKPDIAPPSPYGATFDPTSSSNDVVAALEPVIRAVLATGQIADEGALRKNLVEKVLYYHTMVQGIYDLTAANWRVSRFGVSFSVNVSGEVSTGVSVGGGVSVSFSWLPTTQRSPRVIASGDGPGANLKKLIEKLLAQMEAVSLEGLEVPDFALKNVIYGLGISAGGNVGVSISGGVSASITFTRVGNVNVEAAADTSINNDPIAAINGNGAFQNSGGISTMGFRRGLERAVRMGSKFAELSEKYQSTWVVRQISASFSLSLSGEVALIRLGGSGSISLVFQKA